MFRASTAGVDTTPHVQQLLGLGAGETGEDPDGEDGAGAAEEEAEAQR